MGVYRILKEGLQYSFTIPCVRLHVRCAIEKGKEIFFCNDSGASHLNKPMLLSRYLFFVMKVQSYMSYAVRRRIRLIECAAYQNLEF